MIAALILGTYAVLVALAAPALLARWWPSDRAPRLTIALLQALACSFLITATTCGLALAVTLLDRLSKINPRIDACADQLPINDESPIGPVLGDIGLAVAVALALRVAYCLVATFVGTWIRRRSHIAMLRLCARSDERLGVLVLDHAHPACYCMPGRPGKIVVTSGALERLSEPQLHAVLHHEMAHLRGRHHLVVAFAFAVRRTVPGVRLLRYAELETRRLVELIADDAAALRSGAVTVAAALAVIGTGHVPGAALGVGPTDRSAAARRVTRLIRAERRLGRRALTLSTLSAVVLIALPVLLGLLATATVLRHCPTDHDEEHSAAPPAQVLVTG